MIRVGQQPVRVGYVLKRYPRYSETFVVNEILAHEAAGLQVEIFSLRPPEDSHFQDIIARVRAPVHYLPRRGVGPTEFWQALQEAAEDLPGLWAKLDQARGEDSQEVYQALVLARTARLAAIGHLHAHFATSATAVARLAALFCGIPYSFTAHAKDIFHQDVDPEDLGRKLRDAAVAVTVSDYNLEHLRAAFGADAARVRRIYNGLDLARFSYDRPENRPPHIVAVGRLVEKKGFEVLVDACRVLEDRGQRFRCSIIGAGPLEEALWEQIGRLGLEERVELTGPRPQAEIKERVQAAAAFAAPCVVGQDGNRDGLPTVLLEAMALGTPCVSTDVTGIPEVVRDGETGLLVPQHDPTALADALERLLLDSALRVRLADQARRLIEERFDVHRNAEQVREIFAGSAQVAERRRCA